MVKKQPTQRSPRHKLPNAKLICIKVLKAIKRFKSKQYQIVEKKTKQTKNEKTTSTLKNPNQKINKKFELINKISPAITKVAAWINADTGMGPSIASGSQRWKPKKGDLDPAIKSKINETKKKIKLSISKKKI